MCVFCYMHLVIGLCCLHVLDFVRQSRLSIVSTDMQAAKGEVSPLAGDHLMAQMYCSGAQGIC